MNFSIILFFVTLPVSPGRVVEFGGGIEPPPGDRHLEGFLEALPVAVVNLRFHFLLLICSHCYYCHCLCFHLIIISCRYSIAVVIVHLFVVVCGFAEYYADSATATTTAVLEIKPYAVLLLAS